MKNVLFRKRSGDDIQKQKLSFCFILKKQDRKDWIGLIWFKIRTSDGCCKHGNETSGSKKRANFLTS